MRALHSNPLARLAEDVAETLTARQLVCPADGGMTLTGAGRAEYLSELIRAFKFGIDDPPGADWPSKQRH
ncbi:hypothetical protein IHQ68_10175 [Chelatococcus sambhunathii]|uniref:Transcriptional regulator n=1 Tax=Chelatococcus sambhunathii TaxID=363953 RepID=A0ABU1DFW2_9HYPH|nr:hypothetical protein [Chelatococcus sambhunathii]MDR4306984.1 hypothetical protein [Chelatococcus sambhunathii]